jgi:hypothetical protein
MRGGVVEFARQARRLDCLAFMIAASIATVIPADFSSTLVDHSMRYSASLPFLLAGLLACEGDAGPAGPPGEDGGAAMSSMGATLQLEE